MDFTALTIQTKNQKTMSRQNRTTVRDRKIEDTKRGLTGGNERYSRTEREESSTSQQRNHAGRTSGLDRHRLNDLYERSSI